MVPAENKVKRLLPVNHTTKKIHHHLEKGREIHENYFNGFSEKILLLGIWAIFGLKMMHLKNSGSALMIF